MLGLFSSPSDTIKMGENGRRMGPEWDHNGEKSGFK
jgi:hypothetical protein